MSRYEYTVQAVKQLEQIVGSRGKVSARSADGSGRKKETSFLGMDSKMLGEALEERYPELGNIRINFYYFY